MLWINNVHIEKQNWFHVPWNNVPLLINARHLGCDIQSALLQCGLNWSDIQCLVTETAIITPYELDFK